MTRAWPFAVALAIGGPLALLAYLLVPPASEVRLDNAVQHFAVTTNVSLLAAAVSFAVMRPALDMKDWPATLVALGFMTLGGFFLVHGLATPGVLLRGETAEIASASIVALAGQLAMTTPAVIFAARYSPVLGWLRRSRWLTPRRLVALVAILVAAFAIDSMWQPVAMSDMVDGMTGYSYASSYSTESGAIQGNTTYVVAVSAFTIGLLGFAAVRQSRDFARTRLPTHAALVISFIFLAQAQVSASLAPVYSLPFWNYHALLATATVIALGALFLELDRRRGLERFLPPNVVERVIVGDRLSLEGQRRTATILFTDLRGSTALAEQATPEEAVATVNAYLRVMARAVLDEGAILDKFTGDGLMAIFGAMGDPAEGAAAAARATTRMRTDVAALNADRGARGEPTVGYGIGIHTGPVVLGAVGLPERSDYTAMGDTVNTAARMESLTKELGVDAVVSATTAGLLDGTQGLRRLGTAQVKGKAQAVEVFALGT